MIEIVFNDGETASALRRIARQIGNPRALLAVVGRRGGEELRAHFRSRVNEGNKLGGVRTNFWRGVADTVNDGRLQGSSRVRISVTHDAFAQKVFGGPIVPKNGKKFLTIPVDKEAYGVTVAVLQQRLGVTLFRPRKKGGGFSKVLAAAERGGGIKVYYALAERVNQKPDPDALPPRSAFNQAILETASDQLALAIRDSGNGA